MPSVLESLGSRGSSTDTTVNQLEIDNNEISRLENQSKKYFNIKQNARAADGNVLAIEVLQGQSFNLSNPEHRIQLKATIELFKQKSTALIRTDQGIVSSLILGVVATTLSFIPFVGYFGLLGWGSAAYLLTQRTKAKEEYRVILNLFVSTCNWCLGQGPEDRQSAKQDLINDPDIREMMSSLYRVLTKKQARDLMADDIEEAFEREQLAYEEKYQLTTSSASNPQAFFNKDELIAKSMRGAASYRCMYGYQNGKVSLLREFTNLLEVFLLIFPDLCKYIYNGFKHVQHWWSSSKDAQTPPPAETTPTGP